MAIRLRKEIEGEWWLALSGLAGVLFGALMMTMPGAGALAMMVYIGVWALIVGMSLVFLSLRMRRLARASTSGEWRGSRAAAAH